MGYMMILASGRQIFGIIMIILMVFIAFGLPILVSRLTNPKTVKEKIKRNKKCTVKTKARVTDMYGTMPVEFRGDSRAQEADATEINRFLLSIERDWTDISGKDREYMEREGFFDYCIIDNSSKVLMFTREDVAAPEMAMAGGSSVSSSDLSSLVGAIKDAVSGMPSGQTGDIVIPVYLGGTMLDEVIVNAQQRANLRSGGR